MINNNMPDMTTNSWHGTTHTIKYFKNTITTNLSEIKPKLFMFTFKVRCFYENPKF